MICLFLNPKSKIANLKLLCLCLFVPNLKSKIILSPSLSLSVPLLNYRIRPEEHLVGNGKAKLLGGLKIAGQLEFPRLLHRQIGKLRVS